MIPDFIIEPSDIDFEQRRDVQLFAAINYLRGLPIETSLAAPQEAAQDPELKGSLNRRAPGGP